MAKGKNTKLFRIASEINIGKDAIVEFLVGKGFKIENKSTAELTPDMIEAVYDKFKKEMKAFEKQQEKFQKHKKLPKKPSDASQQELPAEPKKPLVVQEAPVEAKQKKSEIALPQEPVVEIDSKAAPDKEVEKEQKIEIGPKVGDIIHLPDMAKKGAKKTPDSPVKEEKQKSPQFELPKISEKVLEKLDSSIKTRKEIEIIANKQKETLPPEKKQDYEPLIEPLIAEPIIDDKLSEEPPGQKHDEISSAQEPLQDKQVAESTVLVSTKIGEDISSETTKKETIGEEIKEKEEAEKSDRSRNRRRKKQKRLIEIDIEDPNAAPKLKGLKILGKIELEGAIGERNETGRIAKKKKEKIVTEDDIDELTEKKSKKKPKPREKVPLKDKVLDKKKRKRRKSIKDSISEEDVEVAIKKTYLVMGAASGLSSRHKIRQKKKEQREEKDARKMEEQELEANKLVLTEFVTTSNIADLMKVPVNEVILKCLQFGLMVSINQRLDKDTILVIADDYGYEVEFQDEKSVALTEDEKDNPEDLLPRPPIVTIMGHVDHGKTSLLDYIRHSNVVAGEAGGITQHIGAYRVTTGDNETIANNEGGSGIRSITFLDTPGHEAFTAMRARGAQATDIVILVVAADDSVMPQTIEAISHAEAANVPIVVAINKIDKPDANPDRIKQQLADQNILVEEWGGKYQAVEISAKKGLNVDRLLEKILLEAEMLELKANPNRNARGVIVEANMDKGLGPIATVIVQKGTLKIGDAFVAGVNSGKVRAMFDERGKNLKEAGPSIPARVVGFDGLPEAGDIFVVLDSETETRSIANERQQLKREMGFRQVRLVTLDDISQQIKEGGIKDLNLIIKSDVSGSMEALSDSLLKLSTDEVRVNILHRGVGPINESDVMLALASQAVIVGFQVNATPQARKMSEKEAVDIRLYNIIYDCINEIHLALEGLLTPELKEEVTSEVEVRRIFRISRLGTIAGCYVLSGKISRNDKIRVLRNGLPIFNGTIQSLKRGKDDAKEVDTSYECGIQIEGFNQLQEADIIQGYKVFEVKRLLK